MQYFQDFYGCEILAYLLLFELMQRLVEVMKERKITEPLSVFIQETCGNISEGAACSDGFQQPRNFHFLAHLSRRLIGELIVYQ